MHFTNKLKDILTKISLILDSLNKVMMSHLSDNQQIKYYIMPVVETIFNAWKLILV